MSLTRIAMWSGPRNISTAMMRSWENRKDTVVVDEPLYGPYLATTKRQHPRYQEVIDIQGDDWRKIAKDLTEKDFANHSIYYQKQMTHHILPEMDMRWTLKLNNAFLIRNPDDVLSSYLQKYEAHRPDDLGYPQQLELFRLIKDTTGQTPVVIESVDVLKDPEGVLSLLCEQLNVPFDKAMLKWPKGYRESDGVWADHWYNSVIESTEFAPYQPKVNQLTPEEQSIADACQPYFHELQKYKLSV
jgi:hypothetical protein